MFHNYYRKIQWSQTNKNVLQLLHKNSLVTNTSCSNNYYPPASKRQNQKTMFHYHITIKLIYKKKFTIAKRNFTLEKKFFLYNIFQLLQKNRAVTNTSCSNSCYHPFSKRQNPKTRKRPNRPNLLPPAQRRAHRNHRAKRKRRRIKRLLMKIRFAGLIAYFVTI